MITVAVARDRRLDTALFVLRIVAGIVFLAHGWQKFFVMGVEGTIAGFTQMGVPVPEVTAPLISGLEFLGGMALILGIFTRTFAALLCIDMLGAITFVHLPAGFFLPNGIEFTLTLLSVALALVLAGAGMFSIDDAMTKRRVVEFTEADTVVTREGRKVTTAV